MPSHAELSGDPHLRADAEALRRSVVAPAPDEPHAAGKNILYCATIQLAWNELTALCGGPVGFVEPCELAERLNREAPAFTRDDLDDESYVARAGEGDAVLKEIARDLARKFGGAASPGGLPRSVSPDDLLVYSYLFKHLEFATPLLRSDGHGLAFDGQDVRHFGLWEVPGERRWKDQVKQVLVHDYRSDTEFVVELITKAKDDRLLVARVPPGATLRATVDLALERAEPSVWGWMTGGSRLRTQDKLKVPMIDLDILRRYTELAGKALAAGRVVSHAEQSIRFRLDDKGALLKSEFTMGAPRGGFLRPGFMPRYFVCDGPFLVLLVRKGRSRPYFALWIENTELLVPAHGEPPSFTPR